MSENNEPVPGAPPTLAERIKRYSVYQPWLQQDPLARPPHASASEIQLQIRNLEGGFHAFYLRTTPERPDARHERVQHPDDHPSAILPVWQNARLPQ